MKKETTSIRLKSIMKERNLRQIDILELCKPYCKKHDIKLGRNDLSQYVSGKVEPGQKKLTILGMALKVSEAWLMGFDVPMERKSDAMEAAKTISNTAQEALDYNKKSQKINVLGRVAAGIPIEAVEDIIDTEEITAELSKTGEFFGLQIHGNSMEPRICEGDVVIVRQQNDAESGDVVIAMVNGDDATCKRLRKYRDGIELISNNPSYEPMFFSNEEIENKPVKIIGKVVELRGKF